MAQTKSRTSRSTSTSSRSKNGSGSSRRTSGSSTKRSSGSKSNSASASARGRSTKASSSRSSQSNRRRAQDNSTSTVANIASKAKGPAMAGGAALVGLAGGLALNRNKRKNGFLGRIPTPSVKRPKLSMPSVSMPDVKPDSALKSLGKAAGEVAQRSHRVADVASEVEKASKAISKRT